jgi:hypothetical protein
MRTNLGAVEMNPDYFVDHPASSGSNLRIMQENPAICGQRVEGRDDGYQPVYRNTLL